MANTTVKDAKSIRGTNPQYLVKKIIRSRIYDSKYWKEECFALTTELLVDKAMELRYIGGVFGENVKPTPFLCLLLKMLQIQPEKDIVIEFIKNEELKYVRALGALYMRITGSFIDCYKYLEPLFHDNRKLKRQNKQGHYELIHMDEFIDELLRAEKSCDVILPRIQKRHILEENNELDKFNTLRVLYPINPLEDDMNDGIGSSEDEDIPERNQRKRKRSKSPKAHSSHKNNDREKDRDRERHRRDDRDRDRDRRRDRDRNRH